MWESPIYKFKTEINGEKKDILIDVTGSAPNFSEPGKQLEGTFKALLSGLDPSKTKIMDFGAAKLRNTIYLLEKGFTVYACEFDDLFKRSQQADEYYKVAKKYPNFKTLVFPDDFISFDGKFDVVLLINVLNVMPIQLERLCVLALCREKMKDTGRLLWYTQHGAYSEEKAVTKLFDGLVTGKGREYNMFYRDFSRKEIHEMLKSTGFSFNNCFKFPSSGTNQAYVFNPGGAILVDQSLGLTELLKKGSKKLRTVTRGSRWAINGEEESKTKKIEYEAKLPTEITKVKTIDILEEYSKELKTISPGGGMKASKYHQIMLNILTDLFSHNLKNPKKEKEINQGRKRVDITFDNKLETGFFKELKERYNVMCPIIFVECKNYTDDLENPAYDQIVGRLNKRRGMFGIIVCRNISNKATCLKQCRDLIRENPDAEKYIIVLTDDEIQQMIKHKLEKKISEIDKILDDKFKELIM